MKILNRDSVTMSSTSARGLCLKAVTVISVVAEEQRTFHQCSSLEVEHVAASSPRKAFHSFYYDSEKYLIRRVNHKEPGTKPWGTPADVTNTSIWTSFSWIYVTFQSCDPFFKWLGKIIRSTGSNSHLKIRSQLIQIQFYLPKYFYCSYKIRVQGDGVFMFQSIFL